ncbi:hypothetical protein ACV229_39990, partial [Burkholderia sp. MR1-5-21]
MLSIVGRCAWFDRGMILDSALHLHPMNGFLYIESNLRACVNALGRCREIGFIYIKAPVRGSARGLLNLFHQP